VKAVCIFFVSRLVGQQKLLRARVGVSLELTVSGTFMFFCRFSIDRMDFLQRNACIVSSVVGFMRDDTSDR
jgi:hypothetical protein